MAPPGRPKTTSTPACSRLRTSAWAPVSCMAALHDRWGQGNRANKKPPGPKALEVSREPGVGLALHENKYEGQAVWHRCSAFEVKASVANSTGAVKQQTERALSGAAGWPPRTW